MTTREEHEACVEFHRANHLRRKLYAKERLTILYDTYYQKHRFVFVQYLMAAMDYEQLENVIGAIDHGE